MLQENRFLLQVGQQQYPIQESILFLLLVIVLVFNTFLFARGHGTYSIKYELMKNNKFFRINQPITTLIDILYKSFFALPFVIIVLIAIFRALREPLQFLPILANGLIVVLIIYPSYRQYYYVKFGFIWLFAMSSQFFSLFFKDANPNQQSKFMELSFIFYTANSMVFCLALLINQKVYWELSQAVELCDYQLLKEVNQTWSKKGQKNLPQIFSGGLYGWINKNATFKLFLGVYFLSLAILGIYAFLIYLIQNSYLGITGLVTCIIYDIFILIFSSLKNKQRSVKNLFFMIYAGRLLSFIFGQSYWLFGYCVLYFFVGIFVGTIIIQKHFPLKIQKPSPDKRIRINALRTPQFIVILILAEQFTKVAEVTTIKFNAQQIPVWQFAILIVLATWVIILFLVSGRLLTRHLNKIRPLVEYYFGFASFTQYHIYLLLTYIFIIAGGIYCLVYLKDINIFIGCIFLPLIYHFLFQIGTAWIKNGYSILADTLDYNKKEFKKFQIKRKKKEMLLQRKRRQKNSKKYRINSNQQATNKQGQQNTHNDQTNAFKSSLIQYKFTESKYQQQQSTSKKLIVNSAVKQSDPNNNENIQKQKDILNLQQNQIQEQNTQVNFNPLNQIFNDGTPPQKAPQNQNDFVQLKNWRQNKNMTTMEKWENFTKHDKTIIFSSAIILLIFIVYSILTFTCANSISGLAFSISITSFLSTFVYYKLSVSGDNFQISQMILGICGFLLGLIFWSIQFKIPIAGIIWAIIFIILLAISLKAGVQKSIRTQIIVIMIIKISLLLIFICIILGVSFGLPAGIVSLAIVIILMLGMLNFHMLLKHNHIPKILKFATIFIIVSLIIILAVVGFTLDIISDFQVFTILMAFIIVGFFIVYLLISFVKSSKKYIHPHVYSAYGLPIYRFQSQNQKLKTSANHVIIFEVAMILLVAYGSITTLFFKFKYFSIYAFSIFLIFQFTETVFRSIQTYYFFGKNSTQITKKIVNSAFKTIMQKYMPDETQGEDSPYYIDLFQKTKQEAQKATDPQKLDQLWLKTLEFKQQVIKNLQQEQKFLFFWLALIRFYLYSQQQNKMNEYLILIEQIKQQLNEVGIIIASIDSTESIQIKYKLVQKQIQALSPLDYLIVDEIIKKQMVQNKIKAKKLQIAHKQAQKAHQQKQKQLFKQQSQMIKTKKTQKKQQIQDNKIQYFDKLIKKQGNSRYIDQEFPHNQKYLGDKLAAYVQQWRPPKIQQKFISGTGMSPDDVKQGRIGDCYLISSFAVLGQKFLKKAIGYKNDTQQIWKNDKGAYMVKFYKFSTEVYVVIDDHLPADSKGKWVFAVSQDPLEYWPGILQKAYAKLYGGYQNIVSGKCHQVLSQFSGGFPFQILLKDYKSNLNALWMRMMNSKKNGYLLAAGSPQNERGDTAISKRGIVQGHAYSILDVKQLKQKKLIKLKNPHGSAGRQWTGPYSDDSQHMTNKLREQLKHQKKNDGIFWMKLQDFVNQFKSLYICCIFEDGWQKLDSIEGQWKPSYNSFGRPQKTSQSYKNVQYGITVNKKCTLFVSLSQQNKTALQGQNYIYLRVQQNQGKRLKKDDISSEKLCGAPSKPTNSAIISQQIELQSNQYPYTFTMYISAERKDENNDSISHGAGLFKLQLFCNDLQAKLIKDEQFDMDFKR